MSLKSQVVQDKLLMYRYLYHTAITVIITVLFYYLIEFDYVNINFIYNKIITPKIRASAMFLLVVGNKKLRQLSSFKSYNMHSKFRAYLANWIKILGMDTDTHS
jgi:hypothetical protein